jgi:hypothetical protein
LIIVAGLSLFSIGSAGVQLKYLGTAGWELSDGTSVVLVDPYLSRLRRVTPYDNLLPSDSRKWFTADDLAESDTRTIDAHIARADFILITHTHSDHALDLPYIALKTGATVIGTESTCSVARAYGVGEDKLIPVKGGEDLQLGVLSIRVVPSLHGILRHSPNPRRIGGRQILVFGSRNYIEREVEGLRPDVAIIGSPGPARNLRVHTETPSRAGVSAACSADSLGPHECPIRCEPGAGDSAPAVVCRRGKGRVADDHSDYPEILRADPDTIAGGRRTGG